jgi:hypothetical protein
MRTHLATCLFALASAVPAARSQTITFKDGSPTPFVGGTYAGTQDVMILTNNPGQSDQNFGGRENIAVGVQPAGQPRHDLVRFNVTALNGQPFVVTAARLRLFVTNLGELGGGVDV